MKNNTMDKLAYLLLVVGGFNWGLIGVFNFNLVDSIFGVESAISRIIYALVGIAALYGLVSIVTMMSASADHKS